jgi:hypothetical protein
MSGCLTICGLFLPPSAKPASRFFSYLIVDGSLATTDYVGWDHPTPYQIASGKAQAFAKGSWGGEWHPDFAPQAGDIVAKGHWGSSGFVNTDLDFRLKQHRIAKAIVVGLMLRFANALTYSARAARKSYLLCIRAWLQPGFSHAAGTPFPITALAPEG